MPKYHYFEHTGRKYVFADATDAKRVLRNSSNMFSSSTNGVAVQQNNISLNRDYIIPDECAETCNKKVVRISAQFSLSGPISSKADKLAMIDELYNIIKGEQFAHELDGFPTNPSVVYDTTGV